MLSVMPMRGLKNLAKQHSIVPEGDKRLKTTWINALKHLHTDTEPLNAESLDQHTPDEPTPDTSTPRGGAKPIGMSRKQYAKVLKKAGLDLTGQDVFHIIANSHGGADHPDNYLYALGSTFNRTIGDKHDAFNCFLAGKEKTEKAVRISIKLGNVLDPRGREIKKYTCRGPSTDPADEAAYLFNKGQAMCKAMTAWVRASEKSE
jgi:hypothetical protein